eukprot:1157401-Pelagomonas_calceolata.AAC.10
MPLGSRLGQHRHHVYPMVGSDDQQGVRSSTPPWSVLRECGIEPIQFNWFRATMRHNNYLIHCNSPLFQKVFHAGISLSSRNPSCWTSHELFAMNGLHHARGFQDKIRSANPLDLSQVKVDLSKAALVGGHSHVTLSSPSEAAELPDYRSKPLHPYNNW